MSQDELIRRFIENGRAALAAANFEIAKAELRTLGITLTQRPSEYQVNRTGGPDANALSAESLDDAVAFGIDIAKRFAPASPATAAAPGKRYRRPRRMTPKAQRRRMIRQHNRRMRARTVQRQTKDGDKQK